MPKKQVDFFTQMVHWVENDTSTNIINGKEYVSSENGEKIYVFQLNRPQKKRQSPTPKQWAIIGGSVGAGVLATVGGGYLYSYLQNSANLDKFQEIVDRDEILLAQLLNQLKDDYDFMFPEIKNFESSLLSANEMNEIKEKISSMSEENLKNKFKSMLMETGFQPNTKITMEDALQELKENYPNASENELLGRYFNPKIKHRPYEGAVDSYRTLKEQTATWEELINKYNNVLTLIEENDNITREKKILYIVDDMYESGIKSGGEIYTQMDGDFIPQLMEKDNVEVLLQITSNLNSTRQNKRFKNIEEINEAILRDDLTKNEEQIAQARELLKKMKTQEQNIVEIQNRSTVEQIEVNQSTRGDTFTEEQILEIENYVKKEGKKLEEEEGYNLLKEFS
jgi:hypothetical protein